MNLWKLPTIVIAPDTVFTIFGFPVTNTLLNTWVSILILLIIFYFGAIRRRNSLIPSGFQNAFEWLLEGFRGLVESVAGKEKGRKFFPIVVSFFLFIVIGNLFDVIPGIDTIGTAHTGGIFLFGAASNQITPWFRPATTDLNLDLAMALVSMVITQFFGFATLGAKEHGSKYFNFRALKKGGIGAAEFLAGLIEIISETMRLVSFSFRLFGNIFAGGVLLAVFAFLLPVVADIIFIPFEIFVAGIQAFVFAFLTLIFLQQATTGHGGHEEHHREEEEEGIDLPAA